MSFITQWDSLALWQTYLSDPASITMEGILIFNKHLLFLLILLMLFPLNSVFEMGKSSKSKNKIAKAQAEAAEKKKKEENRYDRSILKVFVDNNLLSSEGVTPNSVRARLITTKDGGHWCNPEMASYHRLVAKWPIPSKNLKNHWVYLLNPMIPLKLNQLPDKSCKIIYVSSMLEADLSTGVEIQVNQETEFTFSSLQYEARLDFRKTCLWGSIEKT